jgi:hypothetical protein
MVRIGQAVRFPSGVLGCVRRAVDRGENLLGRVVQPVRRSTVRSWLTVATIVPTKKNPSRTGTSTTPGRR